VPSKEIVFTVMLPIDLAWSLMADRNEVGCLFPGCRGVKILNELESAWTVTFSLGPFSRTIELAARTTELIKNERISWTAAHENLVTSGTVSFYKISDDETEITYRLEGHVIGHFSFLQDIVVSEKLGELARSFVKKIKEHLEGKPGKKDRDR
jgi:uncharacterized membrane protein